MMCFYGQGSPSLNHAQVQKFDGTPLIHLRGNKKEASLGAPGKDSAGQSLSEAIIVLT
jgi:hypothetical protein